MVDASLQSVNIPPLFKQILRVALLVLMPNLLICLHSVVIVTDAWLRDFVLDSWPELELHSMAVVVQISV